MSNQFLCPITCTTMTDPVTDRDGNTFERTAIEQWLAQHGTSPITRNAMAVTDLVPNRALREAIEAAAAAPAGATAPAPPATATCPPPEAEPLQLTVSLFTDMEKGETVVQIVPPDTPVGGRRPPVDVCCVIDISGSMDDKATVKNEKGDKESHGLNLLDVVKHATRAVTAMLSDDDRMSVVLFTTTARVLLPLTYATKTNRDSLFTRLEAVVPENSTNIWAGLELAMNMMRDRSEVELRSGRTGHILLLTDGQPNVEPPRGHLPTLKRYVEALPGGVAPFAVHTFGFGYGIDTPLLRSIAEFMGGLYVFIPDSGLVGTVFVNTASNILCTAATGLTIAVDLSGGRTLDAAKSDAALILPQEDVPSSMAHATLGSIQYGQARHVYLKWSHDPKNVEGANAGGVVRVNYTSLGTQSTVVDETVLSVSAPNVRDAVVMATERSRCDFLRTVANVYEICLPQESFGSAQAMLKELIKRIQPIRAPLVEAIIKDVQSEVTSAVKNPESWSKWGRHYLPSLLRANAVQQCNNFKDNSVQCYGGKFFETLRDAGEKAFLSVPAPVARVKPQEQPVPSTAAYAAGSRNYAAAPAAAAPAPRRANMQAYYNRGGGCITASSLVLLADGSAAHASDICNGMQLHNGATVTCVVRIPLAIGTPLVQLDEHLCITEYHPVRLTGATGWSFPVDCPNALHTTSTVVDRFVYTYLLDNGVAVPTVAGTEVVALGHGLTDNHVVAHAYLGTQRVVEDLSLLDGFAEGMVTVGGFVRNATSMRIEGLVKEETNSASLVC